MMSLGNFSDTVFPLAGVAVFDCERGPDCVFVAFESLETCDCVFEEERIVEVSEVRSD